MRPKVNPKWGSSPTPQSKLWHAHVCHLWNVLPPSLCECPKASQSSTEVLSTQPNILAVLTRSYFLCGERIPMTNRKLPTKCFEIPPPPRQRECSKEINPNYLTCLQITSLHSPHAFLASHIPTFPTFTDHVGGLCEAAGQVLGVIGLRATSHMSQEPWPCNGEDPWLSSKGHTMGCWESHFR